MKKNIRKVIIDKIQVRTYDFKLYRANSKNTV